VLQCWGVTPREPPKYQKCSISEKNLNCGIFKSWLHQDIKEILLRFWTLSQLKFIEFFWLAELFFLAICKYGCDDHIFKAYILKIILLRLQLIWRRMKPVFVFWRFLSRNCEKILRGVQRRELPKGATNYQICDIWGSDFL